MQSNEARALSALPVDLLVAIDPIEDLLNLSTTCRLFRNLMNSLYWKRCLVERGLEFGSCDDPRMKAIYHVTRTCHECRSSSKADLPAHYFIKKRLCRACRNKKYRTVTVGTIKNRFHITEEQLSKLPGAKVTNPINKNFASMRLFLLSDIQQVAKRKLNKLQKKQLNRQQRHEREQEKQAKMQARTGLDTAQVLLIIYACASWKWCNQQICPLQS